jgi:hypothetical protein
MPVASELFQDDELSPDLSNEVGEEFHAMVANLRELDQTFSMSFPFSLLE